MGGPVWRENRKGLYKQEPSSPHATHTHTIMASASTVDLTDVRTLYTWHDSPPADETVAYWQHTINMTNALYSPNPEELKTVLSRVFKGGQLCKLGSCFEDLLGKRPFDQVHYDVKFFTRDPVCVAYGIKSKPLAAMLETSGIQHLKHLGIGVNVKSKDDVPHDGISDARRQALYVVRVVPTITTPQQFKLEHKSYYKLTRGGKGLKEQRKDLGLPPNKPQDPATRKVQDPAMRKEQDPATRKEFHGGKQPKEHIHLPDTKFVSGLINSGIPLDIMDPAFAGASASRFNKMFARFWEDPKVGPNLKRLSGKTMANDKFKRIKPIYERARKVGRQASARLFWV